MLFMHLKTVSLHSVSTDDLEETFSDAAVIVLMNEETVYDGDAVL